MAAITPLHYWLGCGQKNLAVPSTEKILLFYCSKMTFKVMSDKRQKLWLNNG